MNANIFSLFSALWLVDDSAAVGLRHVRTHDWMMSFGEVHSWTSAHLKPWTAQDVITLCSSHSCLNDPNEFVLWENLGSGAQFSVW